MQFALLSIVPSVTVEQLRLLAAAAIPGLAEVAGAWGTYDPSIVAPAVRVVDAVSALTDQDVPMLFVPTLDLPNDLAYHWIKKDQNGVERVFGLILADRFQKPEDITLGADHEMKEALVDPACGSYIGGLAQEICDPVQNDTIVVNGVVLAAWVTPAWFGIGVGPTTHSDAGFNLPAGKLRPGGYISHQDGSTEPSGYQQIPSRFHPQSRSARRVRALLRSPS